MSKKIKTVFNKHYLNKSKTYQRTTGLLVVVIVAAIGTILIFGSHAQVPFLSLTASSGSTSGGATSTTCAGSSGNTCVVFNGSSGGGGGGTQTNCLQVPGPLGNAYENPLPNDNYPTFSALDACGYPSPDTAGVPPTYSLTTINSTNAPANTSWNGSELSVSSSANITGYYIPGYVVLNGSNITMKDDQVKCVDCTEVSGAGPVIANEGGNGNTIDYTTVEGANTSSIGGTNSAGTDCTGPTNEDIGDIGPQNAGDTMTLDHDVLSCSVEDANVNGGLGFDLTNSYIIEDAYTSSSHDEDIFEGANTSSSVKGNTLLCPLSCSAVIFEAANSGKLGVNTIENNLLAGAGYGDGTLYGGGGSVTFEDNRLSGAYGSIEAGEVCQNTTWSGNYGDSNLDSISMPTSAGDATNC